MNKYLEAQPNMNPEPPKGKPLGLRDQMDRYEGYVEDLERTYVDLRQVTSEVYGSLPSLKEIETPTTLAGCFLEAFEDANNRLRRTTHQIEDLVSYIRAKS